MNSRWIPIALGALGAVALLTGIIGLVVGGDDAESTAAVTTLGSTPAPATTMAVTTTVPASTVAPTTTVQTTTTVAPTSVATTTAPADETVEDFFAAYVAAIESGDVDFLLARLHPVVLEQPTATLCQTFIEREILALGNYRITGDITGPVSENLAGTTVPEVFSVPVAFDFQGQSFDGTASFAAVDGEMRWFTECR